LKPVLLLDGYIDTPTELGVPPYISATVRYIAYVLDYYGLDYEYVPVCTWRRLAHSGELKSVFPAKQYGIVIIVGGTTVPGRYLSAYPVDAKELKKIARYFRNNTKIAVGPLAVASDRGKKFVSGVSTEDWDYVVWGDVEEFFFNFFRDLTYYRPGFYECETDFSILDKVLERANTDFTRLHPFYPHVIAEIETARGCDKRPSCIYCENSIKPRKVEFRSIESVRRELELLRGGLAAIRFGKQANILAYGGEDVGKAVYRPNPDAVSKLYEAAHDLKFEVIHSDNANPLTFKLFPAEAVKALEAIATYNTPYDTLALGIEDVSEKVVKMCNLKVGKEDALKVVAMIQEHGKGKIYAGINVLLGLPFQTTESLNELLDFLKELTQYKVRRINIRQVQVVKGSVLARLVEAKRLKIAKLKKNVIHSFRERVRKEIDLVLIKKVFPAGTIFDAVVEKETKEGSFARFLGSYPPVIFIPQKGLGFLAKVRVEIVDHTPRALVGKVVELL